MKNEQRNKLLKKRGALNKSYIRIRSVLVSKRLYSILRRYSSLGIASYSPYNNEANPNLYLNSKVLYFPRIESVKNASMSFFKGALVKSFNGIKEPKVFKRKIFKKQIRVVVVPGVGFDERGFRVGYGAGFYDRFLRDLRALKVGITFECCLVKRIKNTENDVPVDLVVTEKREIHCRLRR